MDNKSYYVEVQRKIDERTTAPKGQELPEWIRNLQTVANNPNNDEEMRRRASEQLEKYKASGFRVARTAIRSKEEI